MAKKYLVQHRRGTAQDLNKDIIPLEGEIVIEIDYVNSLHKLKIGDGIHSYAELKYLQAGDDLVTQELAKVLPRVATITLDVDRWAKNENSAACFSQTVVLDKITQHSRLDLQPDTNMLAEFKELGVSFVTENQNGTLWVHSVGAKPTTTYIMQATIVETDVEVELDKIVGTPIGVTNPHKQPDWEQTDSTQLDFIYNKPNLGTLAAKDEVAMADLAEDIRAALDKANSALDSYTESDPTVPAWAKEPTKPTYTANEIMAVSYIAQTLTEEQKAQARANIGAGASGFSGDYNELINKPDIPSIDGLATTEYVDEQVGNKVDKIAGKGLSTNDFTDAYKKKVDLALQSYTESDPTVPTWAKAPTKPKYTANEVGAISYDTVQILTEEQKAQARANIGAVVGSGGDVIVGPQGEDGYSPIATVSKTGKTTTITITDRMGTTTADVNDGVSGVYVGSGEMPDGYNVQIDPEGDELSSFVLSVNGVAPSDDGNVEINLAETDPTVPAWAKASTKPAYTAAEVGAETSGTVSKHNTAIDAHNDIRLLIEGLTSRLNALADSDDTTLDQMSEIVAYIKSNKNLIDNITTNKVNVSDIINNLTTNVSNKPLSAAQGVVLKGLIDALQTAVNGKAASADLTAHTGNKSNPHGVTLVQLGITADATELNYMDGVTSKVQTQLDKKANDYSIELYNGTAGNPKAVKFATANYSACDSENGISAKIGMVSGHGNGVSYVFLEDVIINVSHNGSVSVDNFKYYGASAGTYDGASRQYGDIFWVIDTTNKIVDFYCLMGQYSRINQIPWKRLTYSSKGTITQHTSATIYSSGTKVWANNSEIALLSDLPSGDGSETAAEVQAELDRHIADKNNPHGVTCGQIGALPETVTSMKNPYSLKVTGAANATYDGSKEITLNIPTISGSEGEIGYYIKATVDRQNFTEANWATYGETGHQEYWTDTSNNGLRIGDLFIVAGTATDSGKGHMAIYRFDDHAANGTLSGVCIGHNIIAARGATGATGPQGPAGGNGTSVTVENVSESTADGGNNVVTFSDGKKLTVKNGSKGSTGENGVSCRHSWSGTMLTVTSASGTTSTDLKGPKGDTGNTGVGVYNIAQTFTSTADSGDNIITITLSDATQTSFKVKNGSKGSKGDKGDSGANGTSVTVSSVSQSSADSGSNVVTFSDGKTLTVKNGSQGSKGDKGDKGDAGYTPVAGKDYFTESDKDEMVSQVLAAIPTWDGGNY